MPQKTFRVVRIPAASTYNKERIRLLTYRMALAQPEATVPLLGKNQNALSLTDVFSNKYCHNDTGKLSKHQGDATPFFSALGYTRRWVRDPDELCVASVRRSNNINRINAYVATYKLDDPHWRMFLLPEVHVVPKDRLSRCGDDAYGSATASEALNDKGGAVGLGDATPSSCALQMQGNKLHDPQQASPSSKIGSGPSTGACDVFIDYSKLVSLELVSRHANFALRHLVQKGHAMYFVNYAQHSILAMRGLVEASYVTCAYGIRGERLRTYLTHVGPLDVRDVIEVDPLTRGVSFDLRKRNVARGVVALSQVEGYGTWFQRKPMLWQRTRRIGALQAAMGAYDYQTCPCHTVGRVRDYEVSLLEPHVKMMGGGAHAVGLIASSQVAQNSRLYLGQFEAPAIAAVDAVQQLAHRSALHHKLLRPCSQVAGFTQDRRGDAVQDKDVEELRCLLSMERLLPVSWVTRTPPPYVPLESDLTFKLQLSKPVVLQKESILDPSNAELLPTGGTVGSPFVKGAPLSFMEYILHQGVDHYVFDDAPSARPMKWWNQKSNMPYNGYMYFVRSSMLDHVVPAEKPPNPLAPLSKTGLHRSGGAATLQSNCRGKSLRRNKAASTTVVAHRLSSDSVDEADRKQPPSFDSAKGAFTARCSDNLAEEWDAAQGVDLVGHDNQAREELAARVAAGEAELERTQARPLIPDIIPLGDRAASRVAGYERLARVATESRASSGRPADLLKRQLRLRQRRRAASERQRKTGPHREPPVAHNDEDKGCGDRGGGGVQ